MIRHFPVRRHRLYAVAALFCFLAFAAQARAQFETRATTAVSRAAASSSLAIGDFNHDGKLDIAVTGDDLTILLGKGDGTFLAPIIYPGVYYSIAAADFNNDGNLDLVVAPDSSSVIVLLGNGDGTFQAPLSSPTTYGVGFIAVGDFNGDHNMDIVVVDYTNISVLLGNGNGTFQAPIDNNSFVGPGELAVGDFNNDHRLDVAVVGFFGGSSDIGVLLGNGDGTLENSLTYPLADTPGSIAAADFRKDGRLDVAIGGYFAASTAVLLGDGKGSFLSAEIYPGGGGDAIIAGDFSAAGKLDLVTGLGVAGVVEFVGNGDGTFQSAKTYLSSSGGLAASGDLNGDNRLDVVLLDGNHGKVSTMLNTGELSFSPTTPLAFAAQRIGTTSKPKTVQITNTGSKNILIHQLKTSGPFRGTDTCGSVLAAGAGCELSVTFTPSRSGPQAGGVTIIDSASSKPQYVELSGTGKQ